MIELKHYGDGAYFKQGWHFRVQWTYRHVKHLCIGFHETNPLLAILKTKFIE